MCVESTNCFVATTEDGLERRARIAVMVLIATLTGGCGSLEEYGDPGTTSPSPSARFSGAPSSPTIPVVQVANMIGMATIDMWNTIRIPLQSTAAFDESKTVAPPSKNPMAHVINLERIVVEATPKCSGASKQEGIDG